MKKSLSKFHGFPPDTPEMRKKGYRHIYDPRLGDVITAKEGSQAETEIEEDIDLIFALAKSLGK